MPRVAVMIDGGHLRVLAKKSGYPYTPDYIEKVAHACVLPAPDENVLRVLYYDCAPFNGEVDLPVSGGKHLFQGNDAWLHRLARKDLFAVRRGILKFRGWNPKKQPLPPLALTDADFKPNFEQKGVDMRIGLDFATFSDNRAVDRIILISNDTDCVPAMKHARKAGVQVALVTFPAHKCAPELLEHADFERRVAWPAP
jgi:uncharacterized LabA/DUF88 family protein